MILITIALIVLAVLAIAASVVNLRSDGYHRVRTVSSDREADQLGWR